MHLACPNRSGVSISGEEIRQVRSVLVYRISAQGQPSRGQQGCDHVQTLTAPGVNHVLLRDWRPGTSIRLRLREASFVYAGEFDFATLGLLDQLPNFRLGLSEPLFVPLFFKLCRVRFHTSPARLRTPVSVLR